MTLKFMHDWTHSLNNDKVENQNCKIAPKHSNQWENAINKETCLSKESELLSKFPSPLTPSPLPHNQGDLCSKFLTTWTPYLVENIPPRFRELLNNKPALSGFLVKSSRDKPPQIKVYPPSPKKMGTHMLPFRVFEGGGRTSHCLGVKNRLLMSKIGYIRLGYSSSIAKNYPVFLGEIKLGCHEES